MNPKTILPRFDAHLANRSLQLTAVVTGGAALALLGIIQRETRDLDLGDCLALAPTPNELQAASTWLATQDLNPDWPAHVHVTHQDLGRRLGHGL